MVAFPKLWPLNVNPNIFDVMLKKQHHIILRLFLIVNSNTNYEYTHLYFFWLNVLSYKNEKVTKIKQQNYYYYLLLF